MMVQETVHVTHYTVPAPVPQPVAPQTKVHEVVHHHYGTVYRTFGAPSFLSGLYGLLVCLE